MLLLLNYYRRGPPFLFVVLYLSYFLLYPFLSCPVLFQKFIKWFFFSHRILQSYQISKKKKNPYFLLHLNLWNLYYLTCSIRFLHHLLIGLIHQIWTWEAILMLKGMNEKIILTYHFVMEFLIFMSHIYNWIWFD
jgi:hypothetical protein